MKKTILFVDDEDINLFILSKRFERQYEVITANSAIEGLEMIKTYKDQIDALITDLKMPDMSGIEMIEKSSEAIREIPRFLLTGYNRNAEIEVALEKQIIHKVFQKPFDYEEINEALIEYTK